MKKLCCLLTALTLALGCAATALAEEEARTAFIDKIIETAKETFDDAGGRLQRAQYSGDIYICKNFTVYLFRQTRDAFRMAEFPDVPLVIPDNLTKKDSAPYAYGISWKDVSAAEGNPFEVAATFKYDTKLSKAENEQLAHDFMTQVKRGDYFQMSADYYYGVGAHSLVFISDYDASTGTVHWTDSNMKGQKKNGERYALVQYDAEKEIDWFVDAFCHKTRGATLYRLRDDIIFAQQ
ncbi:MAG: hypothetical protein VB104_00865 [Candidatus Limiplasma sp.]|nr:hypothetical protein [Candidatus Limiplasma sp.]